MLFQRTFLKIMEHLNIYDTSLICLFGNKIDFWFSLVPEVVVENSTCIKTLKFGRLQKIDYENGYERFKYGKLHSTNDEPSYMRENMIKRWYERGLLHREPDLPAEINYYEKKYYKRGQLHRDNDKPAVVGIKKQAWYVNNQLHRTNDKPAIIFETGRKEWFIYGKRHREHNRPAVIYRKAMKEKNIWYFHGQYIKSDTK